MNLSVQIFISLVLSVVVGLVLGDGAAAPVKTWIAPIGTMFINLIKMMIVPVVFCSLVVGMTSMGDMKKLGRIGVKTLCIYMVTTAIAIVIGFAVAGVIEPGVGMALPTDAAAPKVKEAPSIMQVFVNMIPANPIASMAKADILPVIIFALFVGAGIVSVGGKRAETLISFFDASAEVCYKIIGMIMKTAPVGVFCLLLPVAVAGDAGGLLDEGAALLGAALQNGVELALADDGMRILAQARIVQDVLNVHQAARTRIDEVLALARAIHAAGDGDLVKVDGQHMVGVVEHQRDLGHAHRFAR